MNKLNIVIGPTRAGTTWLYKALSNDERISLPQGKELYFFDKNYTKGLPWYESKFKEGREVFLDISPTYFQNIDACHNVFSNYADAKIIVIVRNQLELLKSSYYFSRQHGKEVGDFSQFIRSDACLEFGYKEKLMQWESVFGVGSIKYLPFPMIVDDPKSFLASLYTAIELDYIDDVYRNALIDGKVNEGKKDLKPRSSMLMSLVRVLGRGMVPIFGKEFLCAIRDSVMRKVLYKSEVTEAVKVNDSDIAYLRKRYKDDMDFLEKRVSFDLKFFEL